MSGFPCLVYKCPGPYQRAGGTYDHLSVNDAQDFDAALASGWHATLPDAISPPVRDAQEDQESEDNTPPTRSELEVKATELGLKFDGRTGDAKLGKMIAEAINGLV